MTAAGSAGAGAARSLSRFRGCLAGALLGDCVGSVYEAHDTVTLTSVLHHVQSLEPDPGSPGSARTGGRGRVHVRPRRPGVRGVLGPGGTGIGGKATRVWMSRRPLGLSASAFEAQLRTSRPRSRSGSTILSALQAGNPGVVLLHCALSSVHAAADFARSTQFSRITFSSHQGAFSETDVTGVSAAGSSLGISPYPQNRTRFCSVPYRAGPRLTLQCHLLPPLALRSALSSSHPRLL